LRMGSSEVFDLAWRDFPSHLEAFSAGLLQDGSLMDISLACEGGEVVQAHRLILSACSPWFQQVISSLPPSPHPVVAVWEAQPRVLRAILQYMYQGTVQVLQDDLPMFLKLAERLQVKGLVERAEGEEELDTVDEETKVREELENLRQEMKDIEENSSVKEEPNEYKPEPKKEIRLQKTKGQVSEGIEKSKKEKIRELRRKALQESLEAKERKEKEKRNEDAKESVDDVVLNNVVKSYNGQEEEEFDPSDLVEADMKEPDNEEVNIPNDDTLLNPTPDGKVFCTICKGGPMQKKHLSTHMSNKHSGKIYECVPCDKKFTCKAYLTNHQKSSCKERFRKMKELNAKRALSKT